MRFLIAIMIATLCFNTSVFAQSQETANEASANANELIEKCDDTEMLALRDRINLVIGRLDDQAVIDDLKKQSDESLSICGAGNVEEAKAALNKTLSIADSKVAEKIDQSETAEVKTAQPDSTSQGSSDGKSENTVAKSDGQDSKPWWKFW